MANERARWMNLVALALLVTALISFVGFHLLEMVEYEKYAPDHSERGWEIWPAVLDFLKSPTFGDSEDMVSIAALLTGSVTILAGPFLIPVLSQSRLLWWVVALASGTSLCGLGVILTFGWDNDYTRPGPGLLCLLAALLLNFTGLLFIRREAVAPAEVDPQPEP